MAILNYVKREIIAKIVYYGPGLSGKTANIQKIHESMDPANVGELTSLATESDRTLFFDFVPIQLGSIAGLNTRFQLFTVPGQVFYNNTRKKVLEDADGVVFVADSQPEQLENNVESLKNLEENLAGYNKKANDIPLVLQFNKQDLPGCMSEQELNKILNKWNAPSIRASCVEGFGVMETLAKVSTMVLAHLREQMTKKTGSGPPQGIKRTYSKEGVSDDQVVKNMLEDIAAVGGAAEAAKAAEAEKAAASKSAAAAPAKPATAPRPAAAPAAAPAKAGTPARPAAPAARAAAPSPAAATRPKPLFEPSGPSLSPEDLLSDLDGGTKPEAPAARPVPPKPVRPAAPPVRAPTPPPQNVNAGSTKVLSTPPAPIPSSEPVMSASMSRLKPAVAAPANPPISTPSAKASAASGPASRAPAKTAEEMLDSIDSEPGTDLFLEGAGSFATPAPSSSSAAGGGATATAAGSPVDWTQDDGPTTTGEERGRKPRTETSGTQPAVRISSRSEDDEIGGKTSVGAIPLIGEKPHEKIRLEPAVPADEASAESSFARPGAADAMDFDTPAPPDGRAAPIKVMEKQGAAVAQTVPAAGSGKASAALALSVINFLMILALAAFNVAAFMGWIQR